MKTLLSILLSFITLVTSAQVKPGIDVLEDNNFTQLKGKRIALITNPTGVNSRLVPTVDILANAADVKLVALLAPEHGIRGDVVAGATVASSTDTATGLPVYSIYGSTKKPTAAMLAGCDAIVYDIQDNGCRSYTFISTMGKAMEAAAEQGKEFIILDRPNPLGGNRVEGGMVDADCISFVSQYSIPYIYGLTPGELARYLIGEGLIKAPGLKLTVVEMEGWKRSMTYSQTGLPWVLPSPHIPSAETCLYYPASGILGELDFLSIGVGYTLPFMTFAAPWIDADKLAARLNKVASQNGAVAWRVIHYKPFYGKFKGENLNGVQLYFLDPARASLTLPQFQVMQELHKMYPSRSPLAATDKNGRLLRMFDQVTGTKKLRSALLGKGYDTSVLDSLWQPSEAFLQNSPRYYLY